MNKSSSFFVVLADAHYEAYCDEVEEKQYPSVDAHHAWAVGHHNVADDEAEDEEPGGNFEDGGDDYKILEALHVVSGYEFANVDDSVDDAYEWEEDF